MIKAVDKHTGEIIELDYKNDYELIDKAHQIKKEIDSLNNLYSQLRKDIIKLMGDEEEYKAGKYRVHKHLRRQKQYDKLYLKNYLDEDQMDLILEPDKNKTHKLLRQLAEDKQLSSIQIKDIQDNMQVVGTADVINIERAN